MLLSNGTVINGRYTIKACIGQGGFGITYLAHDERLMQDVVLKEYFPDFMVKRNQENVVVTMSAGDLETYEKGKTRFLNEARLLASLRDLSEIVTIFDYFLENNTAYIVMEYIDGKSLKEIIRSRTTPYSFNETMEIIMPCIDALKKVHEHGLIHRDFTPDNILMTKKGDVRIIDFGASKDYVASEKTMTVMVKHGYAPLEQYSQDGRQGTWTDVYSACAIIYEMLTLRKPQAAIDRTLSDEVGIEAIQNNSLSYYKKQVILKGLSLKSKDRYQTLGELIGELKSQDGAVANGVQTSHSTYQSYQGGQNYQGSQNYHTAQNYQTGQNYQTSQNYQTGQQTNGGYTSYYPNGPVTGQNNSQYTKSAQYGNSSQLSRSQQYVSTDTQKKKSSTGPILIGVVAGVAVLAAILIGVFALSGKSKSENKADDTTEEVTEKVSDEFDTENQLVEGNDYDGDADDSDGANDSGYNDGYVKPSQEEVNNHDTSEGNWDITKARKVTISELDITVTVPSGYYYIDRTLGLDDPYVNFKFNGQQSEYDEMMNTYKEYGVYVAMYPDDSTKEERFFIRANSSYDGEPNYNDFKDFSSEQWNDFYKSLAEEAQDGSYGKVDDTFNYRDINDNVIVGFISSDSNAGTNSIKAVVANGTLMVWAECTGIDDSKKVDHMVTRLVDVIQKIDY